MTDVFVFLVYSFIITSTITGLCEIMQDLEMKSWTVIGKGSFTLPYKDDEEFEAVIRHINNPLQLKDQKVFLTMGEDCVYYKGSKMSYNWTIIMHRPVKRKAKK